MNVAIVDDHPLFGEGLKFFISDICEVDSVVIYNSGKECIEGIKSDGIPDVIFMDILMPELNGIETTKRLKALYPEIKIIAISSIEDVKYVEEMINAQVTSYLLKDATADEIEFTLKETIAGRNYFSPRVLVNLTQKAVRRTFEIQTMISRISKRELEVLKLICSGMNRTDIADKLGISEKTVDKHRENLMDKTCSDNIIQLMIFSIRNQLVTIDE